MEKGCPLNRFVSLRSRSDRFFINFVNVEMM
jgi:hypothetical protein